MSPATGDAVIICSDEDAVKKKKEWINVCHNEKSTRRFLLAETVTSRGFTRKADLVTDFAVKQEEAESD